MGVRRPILAASLVAASLLASAAQARAEEHPERQPPFGGERPPALSEPRSQTVPPEGFELSAREAIAAAAATEEVREELEESPDARPRALIRGDRWQVSWFDRDGTEVALVLVDGADGSVDEAWRDFQVETELARGYEDAIAQKVNAPYVWLAACLLFVAPFVDIRRPFRLLHLDLLVLVGLGLSLYAFNRAEITASVLLALPVLGYLLARMLAVGLWPRERAGPLVPWLSARWLAAGVFVLAAARIALNLTDSQVIDIGVAGVVGADRITNGDGLYGGGFNAGLDLRGDVYGPANYLAYVPFELLWPWDGVWDDVWAAHAAAIAFDLLCVAGLVALGRALRGGEDGRALGWALGFAWVACPWTLYTLNANANDSLVAALSVGALLALGAPAGRGALIGLAAAAKFGAAALAPLFATAHGERRRRSAIVFALGFGLVVVVLFAPFVPDGGVREIYDRTFGYQAARGSPFSVWGQAPSLEFAQPLVRAAAVALALGVAVWPRYKTTAQIAALAAALTIAVQLTAAHWFYFYVVWFLPFVLVAVFAGERRITRRTATDEPAAVAGSLSA